ncbi:MAG TPA: DUF3574 domain-containing protein [Thermoanaerobaculia bacterium]|nr:DUF3574 domain-containing protein [Thermoanaerobaculia bacterium]
MRKPILALALLLSACASMPYRVGVEGVSDRLFCGRSIPGGGEVTDADVERFFEEVVTPRFPEGFTSWTATGNWRGDEEKTLVLEFLHPYGRDFDRKVREIADEYRKRFRQQAVMRVTEPAMMELIEP